MPGSAKKSAALKKRLKTGLPDSASAQELLDIIPRTMQAIRIELRNHASSDLTVPQFRILANLSRAGMGNGQLAEIIGVSVAAMSRMVDGMVRRGLLERSYPGNDRRQIQLTLSPVGRETYIRITQEVQKSLAERISRLGPQPKRVLRSGLTILGELFS